MWVNSLLRRFGNAPIYNRPANVPSSVQSCALVFARRRQRRPSHPITSCPTRPRSVPDKEGISITPYTRRTLSTLFKSKILRRRHDTESVGVAHATPPALHANDSIALAKYTKLDSVHDTPLQTAVDILLPWRVIEVRLGLGEVEGVDTAVQVRVLYPLACWPLCAIVSWLYLPS